MERGRAVQARDGGREGGREQQRGMLREEDGIFIAAAVFIAAQRRGASGGRGLGCGFHTASQGRVGGEGGNGRREAALARAREGRLFGVFGRRGEERKEGGLFLSVCVCA